MAAQGGEPGALGVALLHDAIRSVIRLTRLRWAAGAAVLLAALLGERALGLALPEGWLALAGAALLLANGVVLWLARRAERLGPARGLALARRVVFVQMALGWLGMAAILHLTGGIASPAILFLPVYVLAAGLMLTGWLPYLIAALAAGALALVALLERADVLPHTHVLARLPADAHTDLSLIGLLVALVAAVGLAVVFLASGTAAALHNREGRIATLQQVTQEVASAADLDELLEHMVRNIASALGVRGASIRLLDETTGELVMRAACGLSQAYLDKGPVDLTRSAVDTEVLAGRPVIVGDVARDPRIQYPRQMAEEGIRSMLVAPVIGRGKPLGVVHVYGDRRRHFAWPDADYVMAIARQGATALENAAAFEDLRQADEARSQFVRMVTHELRAPVAGAQSLLRPLLHGLAGELGDQQRDLLSRVEGRLDLLMALINDLLALAASKTVDLAEPLRRLPLQPILRQVIDRLAPEAESKQIALECDIPFEVLAVRATEEGLGRVFSNLIGNAIKYTPVGGRVSVSVVERLNTAVVSVADTGIGIPKDDLPRLWADFFRARNARQSGITGTGLGLSIVKQHIDHFGGLISVSSVEGKGTTFKVTLPLAGPADEVAQSAG